MSKPQQPSTTRSLATLPCYRLSLKSSRGDVLQMPVVARRAVSTTTNGTTTTAHLSFDTTDHAPPIAVLVPRQCVPLQARGVVIHWNQLLELCLRQSLKQGGLAHIPQPRKHILSSRVDSHTCRNRGSTPVVIHWNQLLELCLRQSLKQGGLAHIPQPRKHILSSRVDSHTCRN
jgi:hypothetical protein